MITQRKPALQSRGVLAGIPGMIRCSVVRSSCTLLLFLLLLVLPFPAFADEYNEIAGSGFFIDSVPSGAKVFIDGVERGTTPYSVPSVRTGEYNIRVSKEGYVDRRFKVVVRRNSRVEITVDLEETRGQLLLEISRDPAAPASLPFEPEIIADGTRIYETRVKLPVGRRNITVTAFGWETLNQNVYIGEGSVQTLQFIMKSAVFTLSGAGIRKKRFNPRSAGALGSADLSFEVNGPGRGLLEVLDQRGRVVYSQALGPFLTRSQRAAWNGSGGSGGSEGAEGAGGSEGAEGNSSVPVPDGMYTVRISAWGDNPDPVTVAASTANSSAASAVSTGTNGETQRRQAEFAVLVDSSIEIRPLTLSAVSPGLFFAPSPEVLPAFSYQIEGMLLAGKPLMKEAWESLPYAAGIRFSFMDNLEAALAFNSSPGFKGSKGNRGSFGNRGSSLEDSRGAAEWGIGGSLKWVFRKPNSGGTLGGLGMAAELAYGWYTSGPYSPFGMGAGPALRLPLSYRLRDTEGGKKLPSLDLFLSPLVLWAGEGSYPKSAIPRFGIEGGALLVYRSISAGLSLRWDYAPGTETGSTISGSGPVVSALEFKFFPSNFVISLLGGFWHWKDTTGGFFGAGFGIIY
ncbi:hypothetical protein AGMMS50230_14680 [Spirochaetia bacterium]|nr:hypothetical protein AGMMS50230_14680 [Spirochaetia bacterium]